MCLNKQLIYQPVLITLDCRRLDPNYIENDFKTRYNFTYDKNRVLEGIQFLVGFDRYVQYVWNSYDTPGSMDGYHQLTELLYKQIWGVTGGFPGTFFMRNRRRSGHLV